MEQYGKHKSIKLVNGIKINKIYKKVVDFIVCIKHFQLGPQRTLTTNGCTFFQFHGHLNQKSICHLRLKYTF